jgi:hypothetical protein
MTRGRSDAALPNDGLPAWVFRRPDQSGPGVQPAGPDEPATACDGDAVVVPVLPVAAVLGASDREALRREVRKRLAGRSPHPADGAAVVGLDDSDVMRSLAPGLVGTLTRGALRGFGFRVGWASEWRGFRLGPASEGVPYGPGRSGRRWLLAYVHLGGASPLLVARSGRVAGRVGTVGDAVVFSPEVGLGLRGSGGDGAIGVTARLIEADATRVVLKPAW